MKVQEKATSITHIFQPAKYATSDLGYTDNIERNELH